MNKNWPIIFKFLEQKDGVLHMMYEPIVRAVRIRVITNTNINERFFPLEAKHDITDEITNMIEELSK